MPKLIDYAGRFAFFEEACFALVRDHGPQRLSRHRLAHVLGTSISTVRRLLNAESDLRNLALSEVGQRFAVANFGFVPIDVLALRIEPAARPEGPDGVDPVVSARAERDGDIAEAVAAAVGRAAPDLSGEALDSAAALLHALVEGVGVGVCLGRLAPEAAVAILRSQLDGLT